MFYGRLLIGLHFFVSTDILKHNDVTNEYSFTHQVTKSTITITETG